MTKLDDPYDRSSTSFSPAAPAPGIWTLPVRSAVYCSTARAGKSMSPISPASTRRKSSRWYSRSILRCPVSGRSRPSRSKNRMITDWGSSGARRTVAPPRLAEVRMWCRVTGTVATSRSSTFTPAALQPTIIARFSTRAARLVSREAVIVVPLSRVEAQAMARRTTSSGLMSTLAIPRTPSRPNRDRDPRDSQTMDELTMAPASTVLNGYTFTPSRTSAWAPTRQPSPSTDPGSHRAPCRRSQDRPTTEPATRTPGPRYQLSATTDRRTSALSAIRTLEPSVVYSPRTTPGPTEQLSPMMAGPSTTAEGSTTDPLPSHTPGRRGKPSISTCTLPSWMSWWAFR